MVDVSALSPNPDVRILLKLEGRTPAVRSRTASRSRSIEDAETTGVLAARRDPDRAVLGQHRDRARARLPAEGLPPEGRAARRTSRSSAASCSRSSAPRSSSRPASEGSNGAVRLAQRLAAEHPEWVFLYQYGNPANPQAHYEHTGPEIWRDCPEVTHFVAGLGTSGTLLGVGRFLKEQNPAIQVWAVEPPAGEMVDGLRNLDDGYIPPIFIDGGGEELLDRKTVVGPRDSIVWTRRLAELGIFAGISTGAALAGAVRCADADRARRHRRRLARRRLEVPLDRGLDRRPRRARSSGLDRARRYF